jgi:hypothetical protein
MGFRYQPPRHNQELSPDHISARVAFCQEMLEHPGWLPLIHFSDESRFVLGDDKRWVWYRRAEDNDSAMQSKEKFPPSVMIFGVIGMGYKSKLFFVEGTIDANKYIENLVNLGFMEELDQKYETLGWIFQQDGAPCHTAQIALDWIEENCDLLSRWPANSPDLSPIELLWAILKHAVAAMEPKSVEELKEVLLQAWETISLETINRLCSGFVRRLMLCLQFEEQSISRLLGQCGAENAVSRWSTENQIQGDWTSEEDNLIYRIFRKKGPRWKELESRLSERTANAIKNRWYATLQKRESNILMDTAAIVDVREKLRRGEAIPEICFGDGPCSTADPLLIA